MTEWSNVIKSKGSKETILVADSYYLDTTGKKVLTDMKIAYLCSIQKSRFKEYIDMVKPKVTMPGEWSGIHNPNTKETLVYSWDDNTDIGKKYVISNAFTFKRERGSPTIIPLYDLYKLTFSVCDNFNRALHDRTWPHRHGGGTKMGALASLNDFYFSSILQNVLNSWFSLNPKYGVNYNFKETSIELADELYGYAVSIDV